MGCGATPRGAALLWLLLSAPSALAADLLEPAYNPVIRYFPRSDEVVRPPPPPPPLPPPVCPPGYGRVPTNALDDPSYVGSAYGLGKPSKYGFTPPLGTDDPYGRRLRVCR
ncbi:hypothetical protein [Methylobacterium oryzisoli]|uniref:hypothetical protein n=1 Tax=Methylobacterium oryzisoli TaxID=3385502 RepID=UPI003891A626